MNHKKVVRVSSWLLFVSYFFAAQVFSMERFDIVTTQELKKMLDERREGSLDFLLVNGLDRIVYRDSAIPGSVNIPWSNIEENASKLGSDKDKLIVTY